MESRLIACAIPMFFLLIGVELLVARLQRRPRYRLHDSITSMSCGIGEQVIVLFTAGIALTAYVWCSHHLAPMHVSMKSALAWVLVFVAVDHSYYWFHRASHRVNFLWAGHSVHHQSEEYNLSTALRQNWVENLLAWPFYLPLAIVGVPVEMFVAASTLNTLYQFWIHTRTIDKLGVAEGLLNTPASHRVHHGIDPKYVDKNYGGMSMIWDRLYGTYQAEEEEPTYGTVKPLSSWNPIWANVEGWTRLYAMAKATSRGADKIKVWFAPPEWRPLDLGGPVTVPEVDRVRYRKYTTPTSPALDRYVTAQFLVVSLATAALMWFASTMPAAVTAASVAWVVAGLVAWGGLIEAKRWARPLEIARHVAAIAIAIVAAPGAAVIAVVAFASLASVAGLAISAGAPSRAVSTEAAE